MSLIKYLPAQVKLDVQQAFNACEARWGSRGLMALVAYGSAVREPEYKTVEGESRFLFWTWTSKSRERIYPNDIDIAAIYKQPISLQANKNHSIKNACQFRGIASDGYSLWWKDMDRYCNLHLMCIAYDTLLDHRDDPNLAAVLDEGLLVWGNLPRPMGEV